MVKHSSSAVVRIFTLPLGPLSTGERDAPTIMELRYAIHIDGYAIKGDCIIEECQRNLDAQRCQPAAVFNLVIKGAEHRSDRMLFGQ